MREAFSKSLLKLARENSNVLLLTGDHGYALFDDFRKIFPDQYINAGVAEQNMVGMAAGLARTGFRPIVYGLSSFIPIRVLEQIKLDVAHGCLPVIFIGDGAGFVYSHLGTSHQSIEDIACSRVIPNLQVYSPADAYEMTLCMDTAAKGKEPVYLRMGKSDRGLVHFGNLQDDLGSIIQARKGKEEGPNFFATGSMVRTALEIADTPWIDATVWTVPFIKPINEHQLVGILRKGKAVVTFEEHSVYGGLGSLICEIACTHHPVRILRIGVKDRFSEFCGSYDYLLREHNLDFKTVRSEVSEFLSAIAGVHKR
jgi:transketolase